MIPSDAGSVPDQSQTGFGVPSEKKISDFVSADTAIDVDGKVTGTLHYVKGFTEFSAKEKDGYYFPVQLNEKYASKDVTVRGKNTTTARDLKWLLYVVDSSSTFTFSTTEDGTILTLSFAEATFDPKT